MGWPGNASLGGGLKVTLVHFEQRKSQSRESRILQPDLGLRPTDCSVQESGLCGQ